MLSRTQGSLLRRSFPKVSALTSFLNPLVCSTMRHSPRVCSSKGSDKPTPDLSEFMASIDARFEVIERVVSNLVANAEAAQLQQLQQQQPGTTTPAPAIDPQQQEQQQQALQAAPSASQPLPTRSVVPPTALRAVIKVYASIVAPNALQPWQVKPLTMATGTAFVVDRKRKLMLTNAHVVAYASLIEVRRHGEARRFVAECVFISGDCDLALLEVSDEGFWEDTSVEPPEFFCHHHTPQKALNGNGNGKSQNGSKNGNNNNNNQPDFCAASLDAIAQIGKFDGFPPLQHSVNVVGFPLGGDQISITSGVVSRIDQTPYSTSGIRLASIQIDAAINPGNSGGPALCDGKVVGVAFQSLVKAESIGYIIPNCVVAHFIHSYLNYEQAAKKAQEEADAAHAASGSSSSSSEQKSNAVAVQQHHHHHHFPRPGYHEGFPVVGIYFQELGNPTLRSHFQLPSEANGFLVEKIIGGSPNADRIKAGDIIMQVDGDQIERDITIEWRPGERIQFTHLVHMRNPGDTMTFRVWRDGRPQDIKVTVQISEGLVRSHLLHLRFAKNPPYVMFCGCVFTVLTVPYLEAWGGQWPTHAPRTLVNQFLYGEISDQATELVVLSHVLPHAVNRGYAADSFTHRCVSSVNGTPIRNFNNFVDALKAAANDASKAHVCIGVIDGNFPLTLVLPREAAAEADAQLCQSHGIPREKAVVQPPPEQQ